jgi:hypothetical protein
LASELKDFIPLYSKITRDNISIDQSLFLSHFDVRYLDEVLTGRVYVFFLRLFARRSRLHPARAEDFLRNAQFGALPLASLRRIVIQDYYGVRQ